ncbi:MAG: hypothetical protein N2B06_01470 [Clostridium sp.]
MTKKISLVVLLLIILISSTVARAEEFNYAEIFDPRQNKVVKVVQVNTELQNMVVSLIKNIDGIYGKNNPVTADGYAIKVPLEPTVKANCKWLNTIVEDVYIIIPKNDPPFFMIFETVDKLSCFPFNGDVDALSKALNFNLKVK